MITLPNMLLIGGTGRNIGKTTFVCNVIKKISPSNSIIAIKTSSYYAGEEAYHGSKTIVHNNSFVILEEQNHTSSKDTSRMLQAGAQQSFLIITQDEFIEDAVNSLLPMLKQDSLLIAESNSFRKVIEPNLFLMIEGEANTPIKQSVLNYKQYADLVIKSNGQSFIFDLNRIEVHNHQWILK